MPDGICILITTSSELPGAGGTVGGAADEPLPMDEMIEDAILAGGSGGMDDEEEFMPVRH